MKTYRFNLALSLSAAAVVLAACGGGGGDSTVPGLATDTSLATSSTTASAVANVPFSFPDGVAALGTTAATSLAFTSTGTNPGFNVSSGGNTATGNTSFGSCIFAITSSSFPADHAMAQGKTVTVNPCSLSIRTTGAVANGQATSRSVALLLGAASSAGATVTVAVTASGQLTLNGTSAGLVQLVPISGGGS